MRRGPSLGAFPSWAPDARRLAYIASGRAYVIDTLDPGAAPRALTPAGERYQNLAWSRRGDVLAMSGHLGDTSDLCWLGVRDAGTPRCKHEASFDIGRAVHWAPDGRVILATGRRGGDVPATGVVRWTSRRPFSPDPADWSAGEFVSDLDTSGEGVIDIAISPDGRQVAAVSNVGSDSYSLWLADGDDVALERATRTRLRACKVAWRGDSRELLVTQADLGCTEGQGTLVRLDPRRPRQATIVAARANDPSYEPVTPAGG